MGVALLVGRLLLCGVLALAGVAKLVDRTGAREAARSFGVPTRLASAVAVAVPLVELAAAALLLPAGTAWIGAAAALALLVVFTAVLGVALARGRQPECHCFGQLRSARVGPRALARNLALAAIAAFVVLEGVRDSGPSAVAWVGNLSSAAVVGLACGCVITILVAFQVWFSLELLRQNGRLIDRLEAVEHQLGSASPKPEPSAAADAHSGLPTIEPGGSGQGLPGSPVGSPAPPFALPTLAGDAEIPRPAALSNGESATRSARPSLEGTTVSLSDFAGRRLLLVFWNPSCGFCQRMLPEVRAWESNHPDEGPELVVITAGSAEANRGMGLQSLVLLDRGGETMRAYGARGTPMAVIVDERGRLGSGLLAGADAVMAVAWGQQPGPAVARIG